eukprot:Gregarina_sp_Poly_1__1170@NODE_1287_length_4494_cov_107_822679_g870_i0_p1_GENE_NODE_1287_length_4494_cov_107_822679_g870_i0NODE_1287_length_4494_cov_107_822679_g870_i0_p1_ORF_typecomplete_len1134_score174_12_NODE_1287_length_4494_cov_107_822679_g870_i010244425
MFAERWNQLRNWWHEPRSEQHYAEAEKCLESETSRFLSNRLATFLVSSPTWRIQRAKDILTRWATSNCLTRQQTAKLLRLLHSKKCHNLMAHMLRNLTELTDCPTEFELYSIYCPNPSEGQIDNWRRILRCPKTHRFWMTLARRQPRVCLQLIEELSSNSGVFFGSNDGRFAQAPPVQTVNSAFDLLLKCSSKQNAVEIFKVMRQYLAKFDAYRKFNFQKIANKCPSEFFDWVSHSVKQYDWNPSQHSPAGWSNLGYGNRWRNNKKIRVSISGFISLDFSTRAILQLTAVQKKKMVKENIHLQRFLCLENRRELWDQLKEENRDARGLITHNFMSSFPICVRQEEVKKALEHPEVQIDDNSLFSYVRLLPFEDAKPYLYTKFRDPDYDVRSQVYSIFGELTLAQKLDVTPLLDLCHRCINERDPVRVYLYESLQNQNMQNFTESQLDRLISFLDLTSQQIDLSYETVDVVSTVLQRLWCVRPRDFCRLQDKFNTHEEFSVGFFPPQAEVEPECWAVVDNWVAAKVKIDGIQPHMHLARAIIDKCPLTSLQQVPKISKICLTQKKNLLDTKTLEKLLRHLKANDAGAYPRKLKQLCEWNLAYFKVPSIKRWMLQNAPHRIEAILDPSQREKWLSCQVGLDSSSECVLVSSATQAIFGEILRDSILQSLKRRNLDVQLCLACKNLSMIPAVNPNIFISLIDAYETLKLQSGANLSASHALAQSLPSWIPGVFCENLANADDPWAATKAVLARLETQHAHLCSAALPGLMPRLRLNQQKEAIELYTKCLNVEMDGKPLPSAYLRLLTSCAKFPVTFRVRDILFSRNEILNRDEWSFLRKHFWNNPQFWQLAFVAPQPLKLVFRIHPRLIMVAGQIAQFQKYIDQLKEEKYFDYKVLDRFIRSAVSRDSWIDPNWYYRQIPEFVIRLEQMQETLTMSLDDSSDLRTPTKSGEESRELEETAEARELLGRTNRIENKQLEALFQLARDANDIEVILEVLDHFGLKSFEFVSSICGLIKKVHFAPQKHNEIFLAWLSKIKQFPDTLCLQACILGHVTDSMKLHEIFLSRSFNLEDAALLFVAHGLANLAAETREDLCKKLSSDREISHRFVAFKLGDRNKDLMEQLKTSFQYQFVEMVA